MPNEIYRLTQNTAAICVTELFFTACRWQINVLHIMIGNVIWPFQKFGLGGCVVMFIYWPIALPLIGIICAFYYLPTIFLTVRMFFYSKRAFLRYAAQLICSYRCSSACPFTRIAKNCGQIFINWVLQGSGFNCGRFVLWLTHLLLFDDDVLRGEGIHSAECSLVFSFMCWAELVRFSQKRTATHVLWRPRFYLCVVVLPRWLVNKWQHSYCRILMMYNFDTLYYRPGKLCSQVADPGGCPGCPDTRPFV